MENNLNTRLIRKPAVMAKTALGHSTIYFLISRGEFPKQIKLGRRIVAWREAEIDAWIESRAAARTQ
ncbi:helix-turn-helix transcriptional regulator [Paraburkholderia strydomiana]|uniref:helix-turn-helix transcriptional regulator n=1 Tax=Paraburkholderia strydomiana TaxID=1245417 RepID=UPI001BE5CD70|nr:AlpA family transcriptional regulator [Paraburkholderia strydomiana]MBT2791208.1 AlpA family transcriptional regulator [Paraburkholderia strydomiana]